ncbi:hypothetical protein IW150_001808 [Coemansia sp. RSA 2607]|nr:hypothetical protein IW150_001808 [Coemansia sp. RSA 2607]KAJ2396728.1 hypothetical protein GGI05_000990 [Coemansia sp. RSA 2603]
MGRQPKTPLKTTATPAINRKRGRPRKNNSATADSVEQTEHAVAEEVNGGAEEAADEQQAVVKRGRGRPPVPRVVEPATSAMSTAAAAAPATTGVRGRGRPRKNGGTRATKAGAAKQTVITIETLGRGRRRVREESVEAIAAVSNSEAEVGETQPELRRGRSRSRTRGATAAEAETHGESVNVAVESQSAAKRGRGRPRKNGAITTTRKSTETAENEEVETADDSDESAEEPPSAPKRRRGRLPKNNTVAAATMSAEAATEPRPVTRRSRSHSRTEATTTDEPPLSSANDAPASVPAEPSQATTELSLDAAALPKRSRGRPRKDGTAPRPNPVARARAAAKRAAELERWSTYTGKDDDDGDDYDEAFEPHGSAAQTPSSAASSDAEHSEASGDRRDSRQQRGRGRGRVSTRGRGMGRGRLPTAPRVASGRVSGHLVDSASSSGRIGQCGSITHERSKSAYRLISAARWMGPTVHDMWTDANYIDTGLSRDSWEALRHVQVDVQAMQDEEAGEQAGGAISVRMVDAALQPVASASVAGEQAERLAGGARGWVVNAGLPVWTVDWLPRRPDAADEPASTVDYVAIGGMAPGAPMSDVMAATPGRSEGTPGVVQIWRVSTGDCSGCSLAVTLRHAFGRCVQLRWCPVACTEPATLGVLAAAFGDGHLRVCVVPRPADDSVVRLRWPAWSLVDVAAPGNALFTCFEWAASDLLVAGSSTGQLTGWALSTCAAAQHTAAARQQACAAWPYSWQPSGPYAWTACVPVANHQAHKGVVLDLSVTVTSAAHAATQARAAGDFRAISLETVHVQSGGRDGRMRHTILGLSWRQHHVVTTLLGQMRAHAALWLRGYVAYGDADGCLRLAASPVVHLDADPWTRACLLTTDSAADEQPAALGRPRWALDGELLQTSSVAAADSPMQSVACSAFHTYVAAGAGDGSVRVQNAGAVDMCRMRTWSRRVSSLMVDGVLGAGAASFVCVAADPPAVGKEMVRKGVNRVYPPHVAVMATAWSRNPRSATWLVSATLAGVVRIENVGA